MQSELFIIEPCFGCPFRTEAIRFVPSQSPEDGLTLLFFHAINLHKETFTLVITELLRKAPPVKIKDVWAIDNPNQGRSAALNRALLESDKYHEYWSATEYARAAYALLSTNSHGVDFKLRKLVGVAHSGGSTGLMTLQNMYPEIAFQGLILMDPGILPPGRPSSIKLAGLFNRMASTKRDTWANIEEARQELSRKGAYRSFAPAALESFLECGLRTIGNSGAVTLTCTKAQEAAYYASDDMIVPPAEALIALSKEDQLPVHLIVCLKDEYRGMSDEMKAFQVEIVGKMNSGSVQLIESGGHMFPQVEPHLTASYLRNALMKIWNRGARL
ncbi:hypothetical protein DXG01_013570 [Tephrocybe rancida]|nr:hypothetical protein DXG01_013570 [Tephrocybe rancida]